MSANFVARLLFILFAFFIEAKAGTAAEIDRRCSTANRSCVITFDGEIVRGDAERLKQVILEPLPSGKSHIDTLEIDSLGGDVAEALLIGELVRQNMLRVSLKRPVESSLDTKQACASACVLILMSAPARAINGAKVGLHRPRLSAEFYRKESPALIVRAHADLDRRVREIVVAGGMPTGLVDRMMRHASNELLWLTRADLTGIDIQAPWYQEMRIAICGAGHLTGRRSAEALQHWADENSAANAIEVSESSSSLQKCDGDIAVREQTKFRSTAAQLSREVMRKDARPSRGNRSAEGSSPRSGAPR